MASGKSARGEPGKWGWLSLSSDSAMHGDSRMHGESMRGEPDERGRLTPSCDFEMHEE